MERVCVGRLNETTKITKITKICYNYDSKIPAIGLITPLIP
jgi:hypothetical protein